MHKLHLSQAILIVLVVFGLFSGEGRADGSFIRFRIDRLPDGRDTMQLTGRMLIHRSPWSRTGLQLMPSPVTETGWTPWVDLARLPGNARGSLIFDIPDGAIGLTRFSTSTNDADTVRDIAWNKPDGTRIIVSPGFADVRTFREQERRYYLRTLQQTGERLMPLARDPLYFGNSWGRAEGAAAEYMVKSFRLMGLNSVATAQDQALYERLYGWTSHDAQYQPPRFMPYNEENAMERFRTSYTEFFKDRPAATENMQIFQMSDEPREVNINTNDAQAAIGFRAWLADRGHEPSYFGESTWDDVMLLPNRYPDGEATEVQHRRFYWTRRYQNYLTPKMFALAAQAIREKGPNPATQSFVALSGHALYMPSRLPVDMFEMGKYPGLMPGISDWMTGGSWNWDSHQAVAYSVAPYNTSARRYGDDFGKPPLTFPMMHNVNPSRFRAYTQLANQCKYISYYTYGPDYLATEGFWSNQRWGAYNVQFINRQTSLVDDILGPGIMRPSRVALLYSHSQEIWHSRYSFPEKRALFILLAHEYYQPDVVTEQQIADGALEHYDALILVEQFVTKAARQKIKAWVHEGGLLWASTDAGIGDEYNNPDDLLEKLAGLERVAIEQPRESVQFVPREGENGFVEHEVPPRERFHQIPIRTRLMKSWPGATVRADYSDGHPALAEKAVGKGKVVYLGHRAGGSYSRRAGANGEFRWWPEGRRELLMTPLMEAGVERELTVSVPLIMAGALSTQDGTVIILYPMPPSRDDLESVTITLKEPSKPMSVQQINHRDMSLDDLDFDYRDGKLIVSEWELPRSGTMLLVRHTPPPPDNRIADMRARTEEHLKSECWQTLSAAAWFSGFFPEWNLTREVVPLLGHEHWAVRRSAAEAIGRLNDRAGGRVLQRAMQNEDDAHVMAEMIFALVRMGHRNADRILDHFETHEHPVIRAEVERARKWIEQNES